MFRATQTTCTSLSLAVVSYCPKKKRDKEIKRNIFQCLLQARNDSYSRPHPPLFDACEVMGIKGNDVSRNPDHMHISVSRGSLLLPEKEIEIEKEGKKIRVGRSGYQQN